MELWPVIGYAVAMVVFIAALIAWDIRQMRKEAERDRETLKRSFGWPRREQ
jgi:hypothetical protein